VAEAGAPVETMTAQETWREFDATVAWLRAHGRPALGRSQALEEAVQDWMGAQWAEHNRGEPMPAPGARPGEAVVERLLRVINRAGLLFDPRLKR
jgi:hypothetical protein